MSVCILLCQSEAVLTVCLFISKGGRCNLVPAMPGSVCPNVKYFFQPQVGEKIWKVSLEMVVKCAASLYMGENVCCTLCVTMNKCGKNEIQSMVINTKWEKTDILLYHNIKIKILSIRFLTKMCPSKWVHFQTLNTHHGISHWSYPLPPPPAGFISICCSVSVSADEEVQ